MELMKASKQWYSRPEDQRYTSLESLEEATLQRKQECWTVTPQTNNLRVVPESNDIGVQVFDPTQAQNQIVFPTNWAFGQLSQYAKAPASYLRSLPAEIASINLQWGLERNPLRADSLMLCQSNEENALRSMTSISYGRIWDYQVVQAVQKVNHDGRWEIPAASYAAKNPKRATTLYASDRDVFIFLIDPSHPIEVDGETLFRGFMTWNSEVGSAVFGLTTFLYRYVCDNRIIWGATDVQELRIKHTRGAPERFGYEGAKYLRRYSEESSRKLVDSITKAKNTNIPLKKDQTVEGWLKDRGFTKGEAKASYETAVAEEGRARSVWDIVNGITAYARSIEHTDSRVQLETQAGKLMQIVTQ